MGCGQRSPRVIELVPQGSSVELRLDEPEAALLRQLVDELRAVLSDSSLEDAVRRRLFPDAYEEAEDARAFRELVQGELTATKLAALDRMASALGSDGDIDALLEREDVAAWLTGLTDMRLAIGTRLGVDEETMSRDPDVSEETFALSILHWLGWLQELLVREELKHDDAAS